MIAADDHRGLQFAIGNHFIEGQTKAVPVAEADPADAGRQTLKRDAFASHIQPSMQVVVVRKQFLDLLVCLVDVLRVA